MDHIGIRKNKQTLLSFPYQINALSFKDSNVTNPIDVLFLTMLKKITVASKCFFDTEQHTATFSVKMEMDTWSIGIKKDRLL